MYVSAERNSQFQTFNHALFQYLLLDTFYFVLVYKGDKGLVVNFNMTYLMFDGVKLCDWPSNSCLRIVIGPDVITTATANINCFSL